MNVDRLIRLADALDKLDAIENKPFEFDLNVFAGYAVEGARAVESAEYADYEEICGTAACACGYAALLPEFQKEGLYLAREGEDDPIRDVDHFNQIVKDGYAGEFDIWFDDSEDLGIERGVMTFFGVNIRQFDVMFTHLEYPNSKRPYYPTPGEVATRIREVLDGSYMVCP